ncbi:glycosyltransferase [Tautonia rosea]|uniref:glycosyltransferase n=1 Tax=Tautonia rosea TaxID=2728037 RepID=UPI001473B866|nr:glycosyltransferase [Tautonia rosea]
MWVIDVPMIPGLDKPALRWINRQLVTHRLNEVLRRLNMDQPFVLTTLPYTHWLVPGLRRRATIYYCTDDYSHWPSADGETLRKADRELTAEADLILAVSHALYQQHDVAGRCRFFPHGVDYAHFASSPQRTIASDLATLPGPRIGFFGLIYEKIDFELLTKLARRFPSASLVLIGSIAYCPEDFTSLPNIHLLGPRPYEELPSYIAGLDVLLLPYLANDLMIQRSGPLKLKECLASGRPTVSVDVPEVRALEPHVRVATGHEDFIHQVSEALSEPRDSTAVIARQKAVQHEGWEQRSALLRSYLDAFLSTERPSIRLGNLSHS